MKCAVQMKLHCLFVTLGTVRKLESAMTDTERATVAAEEM